MKRKLLCMLAGLMAAISLFSAVACSPSEPEEVDAEDNIICREYNILLSSLRGASIGFQYDGCTIEMSMQQDNGWLYLDQFQEEYCLDWERLIDDNSDEYVVEKIAYSDDLPIRFQNRAEVQWILDHAGIEKGEVVENYLTVVVEEKGHIMGYAVVHLAAGKDFNIPEVIANKSFPMTDGEYQEIDRTWLDERIEMLISEHQSEI